jgi:hypothetical protein
MKITKRKGFRYKKTKAVDNLPIAQVQPEADIISEYTGMIDGLKASKGEENLFKAAYKYGAVISHAFRLAVGAPRNKPGYKELDFLFMGKSGEYTAIQIRDYDFIHKGAEAEGKDASNDAFILQELAKDGIFVRQNKVQTISDDDLETPELAKRSVEALQL